MCIDDTRLAHTNSNLHNSASEITHTPTRTYTHTHTHTYIYITYFQLESHNVFTSVVGILEDVTLTTNNTTTSDVYTPFIRINLNQECWKYEVFVNQPTTYGLTNSMFMN